MRETDRQQVTTKGRLRKLLPCKCLVTMGIHEQNFARPAQGGQPLSKSRSTITTKLFFTVALHSNKWTRTRIGLMPLRLTYRFLTGFPSRSRLRSASSQISRSSLMNRIFTLDMLDFANESHEGNVALLNAVPRKYRSAIVSSLIRN